MSQETPKTDDPGTPPLVLEDSSKVAKPITLSSKPSGYQRVIGRLTKIEIENYRAFRGHFELELPAGCNLLIYGENGAGKSSLFHAITDFFESPYRPFYDITGKVARALKHDDYRHRFNTEPALVRLSFSEPAADGSAVPPFKIYEWSASRNDPKVSAMRTVDKGKGCLDYKALLRVHLLRTGQYEVDLFELFINVLLGDFQNPISNPSHTFAYEWKRIRDVFKPYVRKPSQLDAWFADFNAGFGRVLKDAFSNASHLLRDFDEDLTVDVDFTPASYSWGPKHLSPPKIIARPSFRRLDYRDYHGFLNEARLSALAITIYFAALKNSPAADLRLLLLDDILIGLDMANRMTVLGIVEKLFRDWQVLILTYHKAWFEVLKSRTTDGRWSHPWKSIILRSRRAAGIELPIAVIETGSLLRQAQGHLERGDAKAAAVYARSAWEAVLSTYCTEWHLPVPYVEHRRELDTDDFLRTIKRHLATLRNGEDREWAQSILREVQHARRFVLNPNAHYDPELEDEISAEIADSIHIVEDFEIFLRSVQKEDFAEPNESMVQQPGVGVMLRIAAEHANGHRDAAALDALARAFERYLDELFRSREEKIPYGVEPTRLFLFTWAGRSQVFGSGLTWKLLRRAQPYLLGTISARHFDSNDFRSAFELIVRLRLLFLLGSGGPLPRGPSERTAGIP